MMSKVQGGEMLKGTHCWAMITLVSGWSSLLPTHLATLRSLSHSPRTLASGWSRLPPSQFYANPTLQQAETYAQETPIHTTRGYAKVHPQIRYSHRKTLISQPLYVDHSVQQTELLIIH